ncbi:MAG TPA: SMP-30/gluconolactonase/LRE family protein [Chloroflexota bacterium]|nr:SMP-30/gluconolactonase/LRE family protein [Chloroflexota bacterium]
MNATPDVELVVDAHAIVGEGPIWHPDRQLLSWVDIEGCRVHWYDPAQNQDTSVDVGQPVGAALPRRAGGLVLALRDGFAALDGDQVRMLVEVEADNPDNRMNDGACDSAGRLWAGTMAIKEQHGAGALYRLDPDLRLTRVLTGVSISNGIGWSLDDSRMYYVDTATLGLDVFDYNVATGELGARRRLVTFPGEDGAPDGLTVDAEGYIWVALWGGWAVHRYAPDGTFDRAISVPAAQTSSCAFGGPDLGDLYITTAARGTPVGEQPHAGGLFRCRPGVTGLPEHAFAG